MSFLLDSSGHAVEIHADTEESQILLGNVYVGRVQNVAKNIQAAFVEIQPGVVCYLPLDDLKAPVYTKKGPSPHLQQGDELVVQVSREAIKTKAPAVTTRLCFQGKYAVLDMAHPGLGVSKKLPEEAREHLRELGEGFLSGLSESPAGGRKPEKNSERKERLGISGYLQCGAGISAAAPGFVLRTNAAQAMDIQILSELRELTDRLKQIQDIARYRTCYSCLYQAPSLWLKRLTALHQEGLEGIVIEENELYERAEAYLRENDAAFASRLIHYQDELLSMEKLYSLERELKNAVSERVWMNSGAYLVIQPTEALTVVDVNTGKFEKGKQKEAAVLRVNLEAAKETARQMRLRNLSGIIIVDFINMEQEESRKKVMEELRTCFVRDSVQAHVIDITKLGLVELTRKKVERPLAEQLGRAAKTSE